MVLADTSVWVDHLRRGNPRLALLQSLPSAQRASGDEVLAFIERHRLHGRGLGLIDMHLLASCALARVPLWTDDRRLRKSAGELGLDATA